MAMDNEKIETLLLRLVEDMAYVKARLDMMESLHVEHKELAAKVEKLEMQNERHEKQLKSVERRAEVMEQFVRNNMNTEKNSGWKALGAVGMCVLGAILGYIITLL